MNTGRTKDSQDIKATQKNQKLKEFRKYVVDVVAELSEMTIVSHLFASQGDDDFINHIVSNLPAGDFYYETNRTLFEAIIEAYRTVGSLEVAPVVDILIKNGDYERLGGLNAITSIAGNTYVSESLNIDYHIKKIRTAAAARKLQRELLNSMHDLTMEVETPDVVMSGMERVISEVKSGISNTYLDEFACPVDSKRIEHKDEDWIWKNFLPYGSVSMLVGPGDAGKSTFAIELAVRNLLGLPVGDFEHEEGRFLMYEAGLGVTEINAELKGKVIDEEMKQYLYSEVGNTMYLYCEDTEERFYSRLNRVLRTIHDQHSVDMETAKQILQKRFITVKKTFSLMEKDRAGNLRLTKETERLISRVKTYNIKFLVIDGISAYHSPLDEFGELSKMLYTFADIAQETGCHIMFLHHISQDAINNGEWVEATISRGGTASINAVRAVFAFVGDKNSDGSYSKRLVLTNKINYLAPQDKGIELIYDMDKWGGLVYRETRPYTPREKNKRKEIDNGNNGNTKRKVSTR